MKKFVITILIAVLILLAIPLLDDTVLAPMTKPAIVLEKWTVVNDPVIFAYPAPETQPAYPYPAPVYATQPAYPYPPPMYASPTPYPTRDFHLKIIRPTPTATP